MKEERKYGIRTYPRYDPSGYIPIVIGYEIKLWRKGHEDEIAEEPLTRREAEAFLKLLTTRSANNDSE